MRAIAPWLLVLAILPRVEDPWPETIGLELPFFMATAGSVLAAVGSSLVKLERQERAIKLGGVFGFCLGGIFYCVALLIQVVSSL